MLCNRLQLNANKTELIWIGSRTKLNQVDIDSINLNSCVIKTSSSVRNLGVIFDSHMKLNNQINAVVSSCFYQLRQLRSIRRLLTVDAAKTLVNAFICCRLDYCNSIYAGISSSLSNKLQSVQNAAARFIIGGHKYDHISGTLRQLHWLRVPQRISFKIATTTHRCLHGLGPDYLSGTLVPTRSLTNRAHLRSSTRGVLVAPRTRTAGAGGSSFRSSAPKVWNSLPEYLRNYNSSAAGFVKELKIYLFDTI